MQTNTLAVMANNANFKSMTYKGLHELDVIFSSVLGNIKPFLNSKRQEEMSSVTHAYVMEMRKYYATKEEIISCLESELMRGNLFSSDVNRDVDNQTSSVVTDTMYNGVLAATLPEHQANVTYEVKESDDEIIAGSKSIEKTSDEDVILDDKGGELSRNEKALFKSAIEFVEGLPVANGTNANESYYVSYKLKYAKGEFSHVGSQGWNMDNSALEKLKITEPMHVRDSYKKVKVVYHKDYIVYLLAAGNMIVSQFNKVSGHAPDYSSAVIPKETAVFIKDAKMVEEMNREMNPDSPKDDVGKVRDDECGAKEESLISRGVEMVKSLHVGNSVKANSPYIVQCELEIQDNGELSEGRPFVTNVAFDRLEYVKESHKKRAVSYKAIYSSCTKDYTAYIYNGGKSMCVFCYFSNGEQD